jgi:hypothetical protein
MTKAEITKILMLFYADNGAMLKPEKINIWFSQFKQVPFEIGWEAAQLLIRRTSFPKVHEFWDLLEELSGRENQSLTFEQAWYYANQIARKYGRSGREAAIKDSLIREHLEIAGGIRSCTWRRLCKVACPVPYSPHRHQSSIHLTDGEEDQIRSDFKIGFYSYLKNKDKKVPLLTSSEQARKLVEQISPKLLEVVGGKSQLIE